MIISFFLALGLGSIVAMVPALMTDRYARISHGYQGDFCNHFDHDEKPTECRLGGDDAQNAAATCALFQNLIQFFASPVVGSTSDEKGRKGILLLGIILGSIAPMTLVLMQSYKSLHPSLYYAGLSISGLVQVMPIMFSSLADIMPPMLRAPVFGISVAAFYIALSISPTIATFANNRFVPVFSYIMILIAFFFTLFFMPETLPPETKQAALVLREQERMKSEYEMQPYRKMIFRPFRDLSILNRNRFSRIIAILVILSSMVGSSDKTVLLYYLENYLNFRASDVARFFLLHGLGAVFVQMLILKKLTGIVGERNVLMIAYLFGGLYNFLYGIARAKSTVYLGGSIAALATMAVPTLASMNSFNGAAHEQGILQGAVSSISALADGFGPMILKYVYDATKDGALLGPGTMFFVGTALFLISAYYAFTLPAEQANSKRRNSVSMNQMVLLENDHLADIEDNANDGHF